MNSSDRRPVFFDIRYSSSVHSMNRHPCDEVVSSYPVRGTKPTDTYANNVGITIGETALLVATLIAFSPVEREANHVQVARAHMRDIAFANATLALFSGDARCTFELGRA